MVESLRSGRNTSHLNHQLANEKKIQLLADWLERQALDSSITDGTIWNKLKLSKSSFYRLKPKAVAVVNARSREQQKAVEQTKTLEAVEQAKKGLKTRMDRVLLLQEQVEAIQKDLLDDELLKRKKLSPMDKAYLRKTIKDIQAEISKIEGDYAAEKRDLTSGGLPIKNSPSLSDDQFLKLLTAINGSSKV